MTNQKPENRIVKLTCPANLGIPCLIKCFIHWFKKLSSFWVVPSNAIVAKSLQMSFFLCRQKTKMVLKNLFKAISIIVEMLRKYFFETNFNMFLL